MFDFYLFLKRPLGFVFIPRQGSIFSTRRTSERVNTVSRSTHFAPGRRKMSGMHPVSFHLVLIGRMDVSGQTSVSPNDAFRETVALVFEPRVGLNRRRENGHNQLVRDYIKSLGEVLNFPAN